MSSYLRTLEKRGLKKIGYVRQTRKVVTGPDGTPQILPVRKGEGKIIAPSGKEGGFHYPRIVKLRRKFNLTEALAA